MWFWIWHSVVVPSDATKKNRNIGAQLRSLLYTTAKKYFGKYLYDFWCAQTSSFRAIFGLPVRGLTLAVGTMSALCSNMRKKIYIGAHLCSLTEIFFKIRSAIYAKLCAQTFPPIFGLFTIFDHNFVKILVPPIDKKWELSTASETAIPSEKTCKLHKNLPINHDTILLQIMPPLNKQNARLERDRQTKKLKTYKPYFRT